jgi:prepilin-type processing-associated H-X9-DG protein
MSVQGRQNPVRLIILLALGGLCVLGCCVFLPAILFPVFARAREMARIDRCMSNLKALASAQLMYANDYRNQLPIASQWGDLIRPYAKPDHYRCPSIRQGQGFGYAMNVRLSRQRVGAHVGASLPPLLYDSSNLAWNAHDPVSSLPNPPRHKRWGNNVAFADGHVRAVPPSSP